MSCSASESCRSSSSVDTLLMLDCFSSFFVESLLRNFLLTTHDVTESAIGGMREKITHLGLLRLTPCGSRSKYKITTAVAKAIKIKYHEKWPHALPN